MNKYLLICLLFTYSSTRNTHAQPFPDLTFSQLQLNTTIPVNFITPAFQDSRGLMWFGCENSGLVRYDGKKVKSYYSIDPQKNGLPANHIAYISEDKSGWLWISTLDGLYRFDPVTEKTILYRHDDKNKNSLADNEKPKPFTDSKGRLWICGVKGLQQFDADKDSFINYTTPPIANPALQLHKQTINIVFEDRQKRLWGGSAYGLYLIDTVSHNCTLFFCGQGQCGFVTGICQDKNQQLWVSFWGGGLKLFHPETGRFKDAGFAGEVTTLMTLWEDESGIEWLCFFSNNIFTLFNPVSKKFKSFPKDLNNPAALKGTEIRNIYCDQENRIWIFGSDGINVVDKHLQHFTNHLLYNDVDRTNKNEFGIPRFLLVTPDGYQLSIWAWRPVYYYNKNWQIIKKIKSIPPSSASLYSTQIVTMQYDEHRNIWYGTDSGLVKQTGQVYKCYLPGDAYPSQDYRYYARNIVRRNSEEFWVRFLSRGVYIFNTVSEKFRRNYRSQFEGYAYCMDKDKKGRLWLGTDKGFYGYDASLDSFILYPIKHPDKVAAPSYNFIYQFIFDSKNTGWLGTYNGLVKFDPTDGKVDFIIDPDNAVREPIYRILEDSTGNIWMETNSGLTAFNKFTNNFHYYSKHNGLPSEFTGFPGVFSWVDSSTIALSTAGIITTFNPYQLIRGKATAALYFTDVSLDGVRYALPHSKRGEESIIAGPGTQNISLHFALLNYTAPQQNKLYYRLSSGKESPWIETADGDITLLNLPPGKYVLQIRGSNRGVIADKEAQLVIVVKPFWYQSVWFKISCLLLFGMLTYAIARWRIKSIRKQGAQKQHIVETEMAALKAQMNPHFMFNCINSIDAFIQTNDKYNATLYLNKFAKLIRNVLDSSRQNLVLFTKDIETLKLYIELEELRSEAKFTTKFEVDEELMNNDYQVPPLIIQPFVENAIIHGLRNREGDGGLLTISISKTESYIVYRITDNGIGRKVAGEIHTGKEKSYGMQMSYDRIKLFNKENIASVTISDLNESEIATGTKVTVQLKKW